MILKQYYGNVDLQSIGEHAHNHSCISAVCASDGCPGIGMQLELALQQVPSTRSSPPHVPGELAALQVPSQIREVCPQPNSKEARCEGLHRSRHRSSS